MQVRGRRCDCIQMSSSELQVVPSGALLHTLGEDISMIQRGIGEDCGNLVRNLSTAIVGLALGKSNA